MKMITSPEHELMFTELNVTQNKVIKIFNFGFGETLLCRP